MRSPKDDAPHLGELAHSLHRSAARPTRRQRARATGHPQASRDPDRAQRGRQREPAQAGGLDRARRCLAGHPIPSLLPSSSRAPQAARFLGERRSGPTSWPGADSHWRSRAGQGGAPGRARGRPRLCGRRRPYLRPTCGRPTPWPPANCGNPSCERCEPSRCKTPAAGRKSGTFAPAATSGDGGN
jgi:hypothetical protein